MVSTTPTKTWTPKPDEKIALTRSIPFFLVHLAAIVGVFAVGFSWKGVLLCAIFYYARMFFISAAYHRYFAHRAFKTSRFFQFLLALGGTTAAQKGALWWAGHHRNHHRYSDQEEDIHSPLQRGFWWSHAGWILCLKYDATPDTIKDFGKYPELQWLNKHFLVPPFALAILMFAVFGWVGLFWGFFMSTVLLWHGTFTVNSLMHVMGKRRYETTDTSRNNAILGFVTLGENWHNNHHYYQASANQGFYWWEIDIAYYVIRALQAVGIVWDVRTPPQRVLDGGRTRDAAMAIEAEAQREVEIHVATVSPTRKAAA